MSKTWVVSDTHWGHENITKFTTADGSPLRPWDNAAEMDEVMVQNWNSIVSPEDRVYHLGDVAINRRHLKTMSRLQGRICLIKGNHDIFKLSDYTPYFDDIRAYVVKKTPQGGKCILSHIPVHTDQLGRFGMNIHGHLHSNLVMRKLAKGWSDIADKRYVNVCVEHTNYTPILLSDAIARGTPEESS
jgi:calcineurin-like phosphoesterase family protein